MGTFKSDDHLNIERLAAGLSPEEVLDCFCVTYDELSEDDKDYFSRSFKKGRAMAKAKAVDSLQSQMNGRDGVKGCLAYLVRVGDEWPEIVNAGKQSTEGGGTTFKVILE